MSPTQENETTTSSNAQNSNVKEDYAGFFYPKRENFFSNNDNTEAKTASEANKEESKIFTWKFWNVSLASFENRRHLKCLLRVKQCILGGSYFIVVTIVYILNLHLCSIHII